MPPYARLTDLIVLGQTDPVDPAAFVAEQFVEHIVLSADTFGPPGRHVLIAWDGSREATRAVHDALPFLAYAAKVSLLTVDSPTDQPPRDRIPGADIALRVARHGVKIDVRELSVESDTPVGDALLSQADELGCDMIVMGTHGRRGFRRLVLGSVAGRVLRSASCPVLLIPASANGATADQTAPALAEKELT
ncbi:nucleotide-binding universal stress UspA family protein [Paraburkholderia sp. Cpub6]|nr:nucleotide-binding universal stress UspA family protein [Paraburkholderia sp. Cpub6]